MIIRSTNTAQDYVRAVGVEHLESTFMPGHTIYT